MKRTSRAIALWILGAALVAILLSAGAADAGHKRWRNHGYYGYGYSDGPRVSFSLTIANAPPRGRYYYDPYCGHRFRTLSRYHAHCGYYDHPRIIHVVSYRGGPRPAYRWSRGHWRYCDD